MVSDILYNFDLEENENSENQLGNLNVDIEEKID